MRHDLPSSCLLYPNFRIHRILIKKKRYFIKEIVNNKVGKIEKEKEKKNCYE